METLLRYIYDRLTNPSAWVSGGVLNAAVTQLHDHGFSWTWLVTLVTAVGGLLIPSIPKLGLSKTATVKAIAAAADAGITVDNVNSPSASNSRKL